MFSIGNSERGIAATITKVEPSNAILPSAGWVSLTPSIDAQKDSVGGIWSIANDTIQFTNQPGPNPLEIRFLKIPWLVHGSYELRFKYQTAKARSRGLNVRLPLGNARAALMIGNHRRDEGLAVNGLGGYDSTDPKNPTYDLKFSNPSDVDREVLIRVERSAAAGLHLAVMIDGKKQIDWSGNEADVRMVDSPAGMKLPIKPMLILGIWGGGGTIRDLALHMLDGSATPLTETVVHSPEPVNGEASHTQTPTPLPDAILPSAGWVSLTPFIDVQKDSEGGSWHISGDTIHADRDAGPYKYLSIPLLIRGSYELQFKYQTAKAQSRGLNVRFPIGQSRGALVIGQVRHHDGISINGIQGPEFDAKNPTSDPNFPNPAGVEREALVRVESAAAGLVHLAVTIDGHKQIDWSGNEADVRMTDSVAGMMLPKEPIVILHVWGNSVTFRQLALRMLDGSATRLPEDEKRASISIPTIVPTPAPKPLSSLEILTSDEWEWSKPVNAGPVINSDKDDAAPFISADGLSLLFESRRPGGLGGIDIWMAGRSSVDQSWSTPSTLVQLSTARPMTTARP